MNTKLIITEGLPGSGKSTTAALIAEILKKQGKRVVCVDEGEEHPADYRDYDFPDFEIERRMILEKWRSFADSADSDTVYVFNCVFLQNPMCETMMRFGMEQAESQKYISEIADIIRPLSPVIIYIDVQDVRAVIENVLDERGKGWLDAVIDYHVSQGYGRQNGLTGFDGYITCLEERKKRETAILKALDIESHIIERDMISKKLLEDMLLRSEEA